MGYQHQDASIIKSALESVMVNPEQSQRQAGEGLAALERLVHDYLPEGASVRQLRATPPADDDDTLRMAVVAAIDYLEGRGVHHARTWNKTWLPRFRAQLDKMPREEVQP